MNNQWKKKIAFSRLWKAAITIVFVMLFYEGLIRLWEQVNFVGTFEWVNAKLISIGQKVPATSKRHHLQHGTNYFCTIEIEKKDLKCLIFS